MSGLAQTLRQFVISLVALGAVLLFASAVSAAPWTGPPAGGPPPAACPTGYPGCDAPLNVGSAGQTKQGNLTLLTPNASFSVQEDANHFVTFNVDMPNDLATAITVDISRALVFGEKASPGDTVLAAEHMRITPVGRVGIGTAAPTQMLDVAGNVKGTGLCIGSVCKTTWPPSGGSGNFGGMYSTRYDGGACNIGNARAGSQCGCPSPTIPTAFAVDLDDNSSSGGTAYNLWYCR